MSYDKALIAGKLRRWEKHLMRFRLPEWDEIPDFGLYMEQTVDLLRKYLDYLPPELKNEEVVTSSAINNYVRRGIMPGPIKKKYYRPHIACLLMICTLKQSLNMSMIKSRCPHVSAAQMPAATNVQNLRSVRLKTAAHRVCAARMSRS